MQVLFQTIHGSRLYGLDHENSDYDYYTVVDKVKTRKASYSTHEIVADKDSTVVDFGTWVNLMQKGVPQALEAAFSQKPIVDHIPEFRSRVRAGMGAKATYLRTMKAMAEGEDTFKQRRHVLRLGMNLETLLEHGWFNPTLSPIAIDVLNIAAKSMDIVQIHEFAQTLVLPYGM